MAPWLEFVAYEYDGLDQRIRKTVTIPGQSNPTVQERYLYDRNVLDPSMSDVLLVINELATGSTWQKVTHRFMNGPQIDQVFSDETNGGILWYLQDRQNTVRDVATWDGHGDATQEWKDVNHISYDTFGNIIGFDDPTTVGTDTNGKPGTDTANAPRRSYTGREPDQHTGLIYYRARWLDAKLGRFISEDPIGFAAGDANLSRYVGNSTPNAVDPSGLDEDSGYDEAPTGYWNGVGRVFGGYWGAAKSTVVGLYTLGRHPIDSAKGIGSAMAHPFDTTNAICSDIYDKSGTLEGQGELVGDVLIGVATGGSIKAAKEAARLQKIARLAKAVEKATGAADTVADLQKAAKALEKVSDAAADFKKFADAAKELAEAGRLIHTPSCPGAPKAIVPPVGATPSPPTGKGLGDIGSHGPVDPGVALRSAERWVGQGYKEIAPGVFRSSHELRQFRMTTSDLIPTHGNVGPHVHFEALNSAGNVVENLHLPVQP